MIMVNNLANALVQRIAPDRLRGRVMGAYSLIFFGCLPLGALWTGAVAEKFGEPTAIIVNALVALAASIAVWIRVPAIREQ